MQITSGMDGAFGRLHGSIDESSQSGIASDYQFNIAYGARLLAQKWLSTPRIGTRDASAIEDWYYALWAYNGWGWVNNPNNPRFARIGTPATDPNTYPYQERVLYLVAHPPTDRTGNPLWKPIPVSLPSRVTIGSSPHAYTPKSIHHEPPPAAWAVYQPGPLGRLQPGQTQTVSVTLINTGTQPWLSTGPATISLTYHLFAKTGNPWQPLSPFTPGMLRFGQSQVIIPHDVLPGDAVSLKVPVQAPAKAGTYRVVWDVEEGAGTWFSQEGIPPHVETLHVGGHPTGPPPVPGSLQVTPTPTPHARSAERLLYVRDTSIPDGSSVGSGDSFEKGWLVFNNGTTDWKGGFGLVQISGHGFRARSISVPPTMACRAVDIIAVLHAPAPRGAYAATWRMRDPSGHKFGDKLTVHIVVAGPHVLPTPTPVATPTATVPPHPHPTSTPTPTG